MNEKWRKLRWKKKNREEERKEEGKEGRRGRSRVRGNQSEERGRWVGVPRALGLMRDLRKR